DMDAGMLPRDEAIVEDDLVLGRPADRHLAFLRKRDRRERVRPDDYQHSEVAPIASRLQPADGRRHLEGHHFTIASVSVALKPHQFPQGSQIRSTRSK